MTKSKQVFKSFLLSVLFFGLSCPVVHSAESNANRLKSDALVRKAYEYMLGGQYAAAIKMQKVALRTDRNSLIARRHLGYALLQIGDADEAGEQLYIVILRSKPTIIDMCLVGDSLLQSGHYIQAAKWFSAAHRCDAQLLCARIGLLKAEAAQLQELSKPQISELSAHSTSPSAGIAPTVVAAIGSVNTINQLAGNNQSRNAWDSFRGIQTVHRAAQ